MASAAVVALTIAPERVSRGENGVTSNGIFSRAAVTVTGVGLNGSGARIVEKTFTTVASIVALDVASTGGGVAESAANSVRVAAPARNAKTREGRGMAAEAKRRRRERQRF